MTITIDINDETHERLEFEAKLIGKDLAAYVAELLSKSAEQSSPKRSVRRNLGFASDRGISIAADFDAPLDEFKEYH